MAKYLLRLVEQFDIGFIRKRFPCVSVC